MVWRTPLPTAPIPPIPVPPEAYAAQIDDQFPRSQQRRAFRQHLADLLLPAERSKTLIAVTNTEPVVGAQAPSAQRLPGFLTRLPTRYRER